MNKRLIAASLLLCLGLTPAFAKKDDDDKKEWAKEQAEKAEKLKEETEKTFKKLDTNKDGKLADTEFALAKFNKGKSPDDAKKALAELDSDKDGALSAAEFKLPEKEEKKGKKKKDE
jgi:EF-hand domain pair